MDTKEIWVYAESEEDNWGYSDEFESKEDAIECAKEDEDLESEGYVYVGRVVKPTVCAIDVDMVIENIAENTTIGLENGMGDDFLSNIKKEHYEELEKDLNAVFFKWLEKYNYGPTWTEVVDIECLEF